MENVPTLSLSTMVVLAQNRIEVGELNTMEKRIYKFDQEKDRRNPIGNKHQGWEWEAMGRNYSG